jgi:RNA recognition motif-containing protein
LNIYVGNLSFDTTERELESAFGAFGTVSTARIATDRDTGRARGFGFVEMPNAAEAQSAISGMNGKELQGRTLTVNEARPREERGGGGGGGNRGGGYGGGGGGGGSRNRW